MKRAGNLFPGIIDRENLRLALARALRGKRHRPETRRFTSQLESNLELIRDQLAAGTQCFGKYHQFVIHDPKKRIITAPAFEERVIHHAIMNICEPVFERWLIDDTFACRTGRGRVCALKRAVKFNRRFDFYLKLDIRKYFDSAPHAELRKRLERVFKDKQLLNLFAQIIESFRGETGIGLPIGSLMSQHFANFYLGWFDRYVKEHWRMKGYVRYMDDMLIWSDSKAELLQLLVSAKSFLTNELDLEVKESPFLNRSRHGVDFLGCRVFRWGMKLNRRSQKRFGRKLLILEDAFARGELDELGLQQRATALVAFTRASNTASWILRQRVIKRLEVSGHKAPTG